MPVPGWWRRRAPAVRWLALWAVANVVVLDLVIPPLTATPWGLTTLADTRRVLHLPRVWDADSWRPMTQAVRCLRDHPGASLYGTLFFERRTKFQYPPTSLLVAYPAASPRVTAALSRTGMGWDDVLNAVSWVLVFLDAALVAAVLRSCVAPGPSTGGDRFLLYAAAGVLTLSFYPVVRAYSLGQIQVWINTLFAATVWCWLAGRKGAAGVLVGLACLIKPQYGILLLWGALRRQGRFLAAAALTGAVGLAVSVAVFGLDCHLEYPRVLSYIAQHGEGFYPNQSVNGLLNRLLHNGNNLFWDPSAFAPYHPVVYAGTMASSLLLLGLVLLAPVRGPGRGSALDLGAAVVGCTLASPVAWEHHYGVLLPVFAALFAALCRARAPARAWVALGLSYALTGSALAGANRLAGTPWNFLQSYALAGGLLALALLLRLRGRCGAAAPQAAQAPPQRLAA
jgi:hypothetical protein